MPEVCPNKYSSSEDHAHVSLSETYRNIFLNPVYYFELLVLSAERKKVAGSSELFEALCAGKFDFAQQLYKAQPQETRRTWLKRLVNLVERQPALSSSTILKKLTDPLAPTRQPLSSVLTKQFIIEEAEEADDAEEAEDAERSSDEEGVSIHFCRILVSLAQPSLEHSIRLCPREGCREQ
jgi:hypothetical protein